MSRLRDLNDIPVKYRSIFSAFRQFNRVQSDIFDDVFRTGELTTRFPKEVIHFHFM